MKSTRSFRWFGFAAFAIAAALLAPASLGAQSLFQGHFTLPVETQWGGVALPAGDYSFTVESRSLPGTVTINGEAGKAMIIAAGGSSERFKASDSVLVLDRYLGRGVVRALYLKPLGMTFYYKPPKGGPQIVAQAPVLIERLPISTGGGK